MKINANLASKKQHRKQRENVGSRTLHGSILEGLGRLLSAIGALLGAMIAFLGRSWALLVTLLGEFCSLLTRLAFFWGHSHAIPDDLGMLLPLLGHIFIDLGWIFDALATLKSSSRLHGS